MKTRTEAMLVGDATNGGTRSGHIDRTDGACSSDKENETPIDCPKRLSERCLIWNINGFGFSR